MKLKMENIEIRYNPRKQFTGIDELKQSIKSLGLLQPLTVAKNGNGKFVLLDGERRYKALKKLRWNDDVDVIVKDLDEQQQKEVPIATDYFKDKLKLSEKAIGVANLINKEKKVTPQTLAKRYGWTVREVNTLLKLAKLHPSVLAKIDDGLIEVRQAIELVSVKREDIQIKLADLMANRSYGFINALENIAFELPIDDVFTYEQAKKDNQTGIVVKDRFDDCERVFTFDKDYYEQKKAEYESREQATYEKTLKKNEEKRKTNEAQEKKEKEQKKKQREKAKGKYNETLKAFRASTKKFLTKKPTKEEIASLIDRFANQMTMDNAKLILKAFEIPFKASEMNSEDFKKEVSKLLKEIVKDECQLAKLIIYSDYLGSIYKSTMFDFDGVKKMIVKMDK